MKRLEKNDAVGQLKLPRIRLTVVNVELTP